jgi:hypothetical protein
MTTCSATNENKYSECIRRKIEREERERKRERKRERERERERREREEVARM